jgi:hypothetical protein
VDMQTKKCSSVYDVFVGLQTCTLHATGNDIFVHDMKTYGGKK